MSAPSCGRHIHSWFKVMLNLPTLLAVTVFTSGLAGCLLLLWWLQHRRTFALSLWGSSLIIGSIALVLIVIARDTVPDFLSIVIGNALLATASGIMWSGVRSFEGKRISIVLTLAGSLIWLVACSITPIYILPVARVTVMVVISVTYTLLAAFELWRGRGDEVWRWPIMVLLLGHAAAITLRIPLTMAGAHPKLFDVDLRTFVIFEIMFVSICGAYLLGGLVKDRVAGLYLHASLVDPLTGITNRRGFFQSGERLMIRSHVAHQAIAVILFDIDHFKRINDSFGHSAGDQVLAAFCRLAASLLRPTDLFGRLGGDEFGCLLPDIKRQDALALAERLRRAFEAASHTVGGRTFSATVSIGVAISDDASSDLNTLLDSADQALYRAKALGRNRKLQSSEPAASSPKKKQSAVSATG